MKQKSKRQKEKAAPGSQEGKKMNHENFHFPSFILGLQTALIFVIGFQKLMEFL